MNTPKNNKQKSIISNELRMDIISSDWVIIAKGRALRPSYFKKQKESRRGIAKKKCVFCSFGKKERESAPLFISFKGNQLPSQEGIFGHWTMVVVKNKFPVVDNHAQGLDERVEGNLYKVMNAVGFHELVIPKRHEHDFWKMEVWEIKEFLEAYQQRYLQLMENKFVNYISVFHNAGFSAGASIAHTHSQIITTPLVDKDLRKSLDASEAYYHLHQKCLSCDMISLEVAMKKRIVFENENFIAICPFASKTAFEVIISPKKHLSYFEKIAAQEKVDLAQAFKVIFAKLGRVLKNPDYNFYLHTAPCDGKDYRYYHWHWTILPKTSIPAGFELGTKIDVVAISPEDAAQHLARQ